MNKEDIRRHKESLPDLEPDEANESAVRSDILLADRRYGPDTPQDAPLAERRLRRTKEYACSYYHDAVHWGFELHAYSLEDAEARVKRLSYAKVDGEIVAKIPARLGGVARLITSAKNLFRNIGKR